MATPVTKTEMIIHTTNVTTTITDSVPLTTTSNTTAKATFIFSERNPWSDICEINGSKFIVLRESSKPSEDTSMEFKDHHVVFLGSIEAEKSIYIQAASVIALANLTAKEGDITIEVSEKCILPEGRLSGRVSTKCKDENRHCLKQDSWVIESRLARAFKKFEKGISKRDARAIIAALIEVVSATKVADWKNRTVSADEAFEFFGIPVTTENQSS